MRFSILAAARKAGLLLRAAHGKSAWRVNAIKNARRGIMVTVFFAMTSPIYACPMCKDSTVNSDNNTSANATVAAAQNPGLDFNKSIYIMLGGLASVVGLTGGVMYKATRYSRKYSR
jgi:hypothetical protein